jgi:MerR family transcriptional regulator, redox-sensitive transcriptional activator SoxR
VDDPISIGDVALRTGVPASTLRFYDRIGLVSASGRSGGRRRYNEGAIQRLRAVLFCQRSGFTLDEIAELLDGERRWPGLARRRLEELGTRIEELHQARTLLQAALDCGCRRLASCDRTAHLATLGLQAETDAAKWTSSRRPAARART